MTMLKNRPQLSSRTDTTPKFREVKPTSKLLGFSAGYIRKYERRTVATVATGETNNYYNYYCYCKGKKLRWVIDFTPEMEADKVVGYHLSSSTSLLREYNRNVLIGAQFKKKKKQLQLLPLNLITH